MKAENFFTQTERDSITKAISEVESKTDGEVAVMIVDQSDTYPEGQIIAGGIMGIVLALILTELLWGNSLWIFALNAVFLSILCGWIVNYLPDVKRFFTPDSRFEIQVQDNALISFYEKGLYKTRNETGVLFFISLFEHKVWILADKGIYNKIQQETLQEYASDIALAIKTGKAAEILCREIKNVGEILAKHFPVKPDDTNELSNEVIIG